MYGSLVIRRLVVCLLLRPVYVSIAFIFDEPILLFLFNEIQVLIIKIVIGAGIVLLAVKLLNRSILFMK